MMSISICAINEQGLYVQDAPGLCDIYLGIGEDGGGRPLANFAVFPAGPSAENE